MDQAVRIAGVIEAARGLDLLDDNGGLKPLDSLSVLDMVLELERVMSIKISSHSINIEHFESIESISAWLEELSQAGD
jgi:acyl carrier protein